MGIPIDEALKAYVNIRDDLTKQERQFKEAKAKAKSQLTQIEAYLMQQCIDTGTDSVKAGGHTAFKHTKDSVSVDDKDAFRTALANGMATTMVDLHVISADDIACVTEAIAGSSAFDLLTLSANKTNCKAFMADHKGLMPGGVAYFKETVIQVRKGK